MERHGRTVLRGGGEQERGIRLLQPVTAPFRSSAEMPHAFAAAPKRTIAEEGAETTPQFISIREPAWAPTPDESSGTAEALGWSAGKGRGSEQGGCGPAPASSRRPETRRAERELTERRPAAWRRDHTPARRACCCLLPRRLPPSGARRANGRGRPSPQHAVQHRAECGEPAER